MKYDTAEKNYLEDAVRIADCLNGYFFHGSQVIRPEEIREMDSQLISISEETGKSEKHYHDLVCSVVRGVNCLIFGFLQNRKDKESLQNFVKENREALLNMRRDLARAISRFTYSKRLQEYLEKEEEKKMDEEKKNNEKEDTMDLYSALDEWFEDYWRKGEQEGRRKGRLEGEWEGRRKGRFAGRLEGEEKVNRLNAILLKERRYEDLRRATLDREFQKELMERYHIHSAVES